MNFNFFKAVFLLIVMINIIVTQSRSGRSSNSNRRTNMRPKNINDNCERNEKKIMVVFNGSCVDSIEDVQEKINSLLQEYLCLSKWEGLHKNENNISGIYKELDGDYHTYLEVNETNNGTSCVDTIHVDFEEYCIKMIDYELKLKAIGCVSSSVYSYPLSSYYRWHLDKIDGVTDNSYQHIDTSTIDGNVDVYVLDSGILESHYEFSRVKSYTLMDSTYSVPETGHGTHVAGIIVGRTCGITNHNLFDYPVCRGSTEACYSSYIEDAFAAIRSRLLSTGRRGVINMSFGTSTIPPTYYQEWYNSQLLNLVNAGGIPVAAAGNEAQDACISFPAASPSALSIGSHDTYYNASVFSNYGSCVDIYAPGDGILSSWNTNTNSYAAASGTSMAAPVVSGLIADLLWYNNALTFSQVRNILQTSSNNLNVKNCVGTSACKAIKMNCNAIYNAPATTTTTASTTTTTTTATTKPPTTSTTTKTPTSSTTTKPPTSSTTKSPTTTKPPTTTKTPTTTTTTTTCRAKYASCTSSSQCCSANCRRRACA